MFKKKSLRVMLVIILSVLVVAGSGLAYYRLSRIQGRIEASVVNESAGEQGPKVVVFTQDRAFKNEVMKQVIADIEKSDMYLEVQPIEAITKDLDQWDKVVIFTTIQSSEPPENVLPVITKYKEDKRVGIFLTAESGEWAHQPDDIEAFTAASRNLDNVDQFTHRILDFIKE